MNNASERAVVAALTAKDDMSEEIIYSTEVIEQEVEETVEVMEEEVVEIVEITVEEADETVEEEEILNEAVVTTSTPSTTTTTTTTAATAFSAQELEETENSPHANYSEIREDSESLNDSTQEDDPGVVPQRFKSASQYKVERGLSRRGYESSKRVVNYDADEDWEDEENEQHHQISESRGSRSGRSGAVVSSSQPRKNHSLNGKRTSNARGDDYSSSSNRSNAEPAYKIAKTRASSDYADARNCGNTNDMEEMEEEEEEEEEEEDEEEENQHEIVKSAENNLVYTVLGSKKSTSSGGKSKRESALSQSQQDASYMKMERVDEDTIPVEGTIYYEGDNMETVYLAQSGNEGTEEYQYEGQTDEQEEQGWETANEATGEEHEEEEDVQQDQIFLHEDENGQLYFKDDNGELQPVYLTADGNYAIAENNGEEQEAHENANNRQQPSPSSSTGAQVAKSFEEDSFIVPELEQGVASGSNANDPDNEDNNTVTISLIISEDENGQKRTQVIIPTTDNLKCELCAKSFKTPFQLLRHNRLKHAREEDITTRNFPCDLCPKRYSDQNTLARHRKTHIGDRPFGCLECGKSFPTSTALRRHLTQHNPQSRPLPCIYCGRRFLEKSALTKHEQSHLAGDQRTHTCDICHKSFLQAADLNAHKKNHDPDKKFDCEVCGREFNRLNNLQRHMMVHKQKQGQNQEILACDVCGITYKFMSSLTRHMVTSHMNPEKLRQQAEEQRKKRENNYRRYLENRKMYETQHTGSGFASTGKRAGSGGYRSSNDNDEDTA